MIGPIQSASLTPITSTNDNEGRIQGPEKITPVSMLPDYFDHLNIADDMAALRPQLGNLTSQRLASLERLNNAVELDIEGSAANLIPDIQSVMSPQQLLQLLRQRFDDISDIWLILQSMIANSQRWQLQCQLLEQTQDLLEAEASDEERQALWAGVNVHKLAHQYAKLTQCNARQLRIWYRVWLSWEEEEEASFLWAMMDEVEFSSLSTIFHYISRALRADINSLRPSTQPERLSTLLGKISAITRFTTLIKQLGLFSFSTNHCSAPLDTPLPEQVARFLSAVLASPVTFLPQWQTLRGHLEPCDLSVLNGLLRECRHLIQALPDIFFREESDRERLDAKVLQVLNELWIGQAIGLHDVEC